MLNIIKNLFLFHIIFSEFSPNVELKVISHFGRLCLYCSVCDIPENEWVRARERERRLFSINYNFMFLFSTLQHRRFFFTLPTLGHSSLLCTFSFSQKRAATATKPTAAFRTLFCWCSCCCCCYALFIALKNSVENVYEYARNRHLFEWSTHSHTSKQSSKCEAQRWLEKEVESKKVENKERKREWEKKKGTEKERKKDRQTVFMELDESLRNTQVIART